MEIFWRTIAYYNSATWLLQIVIILIGIALTGLLIGRPRPWVKMAMRFYMIGLYTWISLVYYYIYCARVVFVEGLEVFADGVLFVEGFRYEHCHGMR